MTVAGSGLSTYILLWTIGGFNILAESGLIFISISFLGAKGG